MVQASIIIHPRSQVNLPDDHVTYKIADPLTGLVF